MYVPSEVRLEKRARLTTGVTTSFLFLIFFVAFVFAAFRVHNKNTAARAQAKAAAQATTSGPRTFRNGNLHPAEMPAEMPAANNNDNTEREALPVFATPRNRSPTPSVYSGAHNEFFPEYTEHRLPTVPPPVYTRVAVE